MDRFASEHDGWLLPTTSSDGVTVPLTTEMKPLRTYLTRLQSYADCLEFGDPSEFLETLDITATKKAKLTEVWVMPMVGPLSLGSMRPGGMTSSSTEIPLERVLFESDEAIQVLLGRPGSGKSTICRYIAAKLANDALDGDLTRETIPILVPIRFVQSDTMNDDLAAIVRTSVRILPGMSEAVSEAVLSLLMANIDRCCLLIDGFDEIPVDIQADEASGGMSRSQVHAAIEGFHRDHPEARVVLTSRFAEYQDCRATVLTSAVHYAITTFNRQQIERSIISWHRAALLAAGNQHNRLPNWLARERALLDLVRFDPDLGKLAETPLLLNLMQIVFRQANNFPRTISELGGRAAQFLMLKNPGFNISDADDVSNSAGGQTVIAALRLLAYRITLDHSESSGLTFTPGAIYDAVDSIIDQRQRSGQRVPSPDQVVAMVQHIEHGQGIIVKIGPRRYEFAHNVFREVLAGQQLDQLEPSEMTLLLTDLRWLLPLRYWAGWKVSSANRDATYVSSVAREILAYGTALTGRSQTIALLAVGEMVTEITRPGSAVRQWASVGSLQAEVVRLLVGLLENRSSEFDLRMRIGDVLSSLGDPRVELISRDPGAFVASTVPLKPEGLITFGRALPHRITRDKYARVPASPRLAGSLAPFSIGLTPVTNMEFSRFIEDGGYQTEEYWQSEQGRAWARQDDAILAELGELMQEEAELHYQTEIEAGRITSADLRQKAHEPLRRQAPLYWHNPRFNRANQPVVGVNFWEAEAYCVWLNGWIARHGYLQAGMVVRLPTEFEWEYAARRGSAEPYPWGSEAPAQALYAHTSDNHNPARDGTCAVGLLPWARWPEGPMDMVGNVWEWTSSPTRPYGTAFPNNAAELDDCYDRVCRGGSWMSREPESSEVTFRSFDPPFNAYEDLGIRVAVAALQ